MPPLLPHAIIVARKTVTIFCHGSYTIFKINTIIARSKICKVAQLLSLSIILCYNDIIASLYQTQD